MKDVPTIQTVLNEIVEGKNFAVNAQPKALESGLNPRGHAPQPDQSRQVNITRQTVDGLVKFTTETSNNNVVIPDTIIFSGNDYTDNWPTKQAFIDDLLAFIADSPNGIDVVDGVITNTRPEA